MRRFESFWGHYTDPRPGRLRRLGGGRAGPGCRCPGPAPGPWRSGVPGPASGRGDVLGVGQHVADVGVGPPADRLPGVDRDRGRVKREVGVERVPQAGQPAVEWPVPKPGLSRARRCSACRRQSSTPASPAARSLVVAYDLTRADPGAVAALRERALAQVLFERAMRWAGPPRATVTGLLGQLVIAPWEPQPGRQQDQATGYGGRQPPCGGRRRWPRQCRPRPTTKATAPLPPDTGQDLRRFAETITDARLRDRGGCWPGDARECIPGTGPGPSSRF